MSAKRMWIAASAGLATFVGGYGVRVLAEGAPAEQPLFYSGVLETNGQLAEGEHTITLKLYNAASGGDQGCAIEQVADVKQGRFRIDASECADAMRSQPDVWVAVSFTDAEGVEREIPGRSKVGAVPYALEADHAKEASAARGDLLATIEALTTRIAALEAGGSGGPPVSLTAFQALKKTQGPLAEGSTELFFDEEVFDLTDEYDPAEGTFTAKQDGRYEFFCSIAWDITDESWVGTLEAQIMVRGSEYIYNGFTGNGAYATRQVHAVVELAEGDTVQCHSWQSDANVTLSLEAGRTSFEGRRFSL